MNTTTTIDAYRVEGRTFFTRGEITNGVKLTDEQFESLGRPDRITITIEAD